MVTKKILSVSFWYETVWRGLYMNQKYHSPKDYQDAARSEITSVLELAYLAKSEYSFVKLAVANNPNVTQEILDALVPAELNNWTEQELAAALTENHRTSPQTLGKLADKLTPFLNSERNNDMAFKAGVNLFCHPDHRLLRWKQF